jgi:hypothetical protein
MMDLLRSLQSSRTNKSKFLNFREHKGVAWDVSCSVGQELKKAARIKVQLIRVSTVSKSEQCAEVEILKRATEDVTFSHAEEFLAYRPYDGSLQILPSLNFAWFPRFQKLPSLSNVECCQGCLRGGTRIGWSLLRVLCCPTMVDEELAGKLTAGVMLSIYANTFW